MDENEDPIIIKLTRTVSLLLVETDKRWRKYLCRKNVKWITCAPFNKVTYGTMNVALMAHKKLTKFLKECRFEMNPYVPCLWNKMIMEKQLTLLFHTDDSTMTHSLPQKVTDHMYFWIKVMARKII